MENDNTCSQEEIIARKCLREVLEIIKTDGKIRVPPNNDVFLLRFIRAKKYNPDVVYDSLKKYYEARQMFPKNFEKFYPSNYLHVLKSGVVSLLKHRDEKQRKIFVFRLSKWDPHLITFEDITMTCVLIAEQMSWNPLNQCAGAVILIDESGLRLGHVGQLSLSALHKLVILLQECFPGRYKALHIMNQPYILDLLANLVKGFIKKKLVKRIIIHSSLCSLLEQISPTILPQSLGGDLSEEEAFDEELVPNMMKLDNHYKELLNFGFVQS